MTIMQGVVMVFINWYEPTVFDSNDKFVNTTKPQKDNASGSMDIKGRLFGWKIFACLHSTNPSEVTMKCMHVNVIFGKL